MRTEGPNPGMGLAILRVALGVVFVTHGAHKLFVSGVEPVGQFLGSLGIPLAGAAAWGVTLLEFFGGLALIVGFLVTPVALLLGFHMLMGIVLVHAQNGWYVVGPGQGGVEFNVVLIAGLAALMLAGPGAAALDARQGEGAPVTAAGGSGSGRPGGGPSETGSPAGGDVDM